MNTFWCSSFSFFDLNVSAGYHGTREFLTSCCVTFWLPICSSLTSFWTYWLSSFSIILSEASGTFESFFLLFIFDFNYSFSYFNSIEETKSSTLSIRTQMVKLKLCFFVRESLSTPALSVPVRCLSVPWGPLYAHCCCAATHIRSVSLQDDPEKWREYL